MKLKLKETIKELEKKIFKLEDELVILKREVAKKRVQLGKLEEQES